MRGTTTTPRPNKIGQKHPDPAGVFMAAAAVRAYWKAACEFDGLMAGTRGASFSKENPFLAYHARANEELRAAIEESRRARG